MGFIYFWGGLCGDGWGGLCLFFVFLVLFFVGGGFFCDFFVCYFVCLLFLGCCFLLCVHILVYEDTVITDVNTCAR